DRAGRVHTVSVTDDGAAIAPPPASIAPIAPAGPDGARADDDASGVPFLGYAREAADSYALPVPLVVAVMKVESGFNPHAISNKGAMGLMQLMPPTASDMGVTDPFDPRQSLLGGARFLRFLMDEFHGDLARVLAAYHAGAARIHKSGGAIPFEETRKYVSAVLRTYGELIVERVGQPDA